MKTSWSLQTLGIWILTQSIICLEWRRKKLWSAVVLIWNAFFCFLPQANPKEMFEDDDLDVSSGSDFDDDEDPDKIEVPGIIL